MFSGSIENAVAWVVILKCVSQREASSQISLLASFPNCNLSSLRVTSPSTLAAPAPATFLSLVWGKITGSGPFDPVSKSLKLVFHCSHDLVCSWCDVEVVPLPLICDIVATSRLPKQRFCFLRACLCSYFEVRLCVFVSFLIITCIECFLFLIILISNQPMSLIHFNFNMPIA